MVSDTYHSWTSKGLLAWNIDQYPTSGWIQILTTLGESPPNILVHPSKFETHLTALLVYTPALVRIRQWQLPAPCRLKRQELPLKRSRRWSWESLRSFTGTWSGHRDEGESVTWETVEVLWHVWRHFQKCLRNVWLERYLIGKRILSHSFPALVSVVARINVFRSLWKLSKVENYTIIRDLSWCYILALSLVFWLRTNMASFEKSRNSTK